MSIKEENHMWNHEIDYFERENMEGCLDITAKMSLLHVTGYCGDLEEEESVRPLAWEGGARVQEGDQVSMQKEGIMMNKMNTFWKENRRDLVGCAMFTCFLMVMTAARLAAYI